jgi:hypothetical protein
MIGAVSTAPISTPAFACGWFMVTSRRGRRTASIGSNN